MEKIIKRLRLDRHAYYETHLSIINCLVPIKLTPMEIKVLASFMALEGSISETQYRFSASAKKIVMARLEITAQGLSNYMRELKLKQFLIEDEQTKVIGILPILLPEKEQQLYSLKLENLN